MRQASVWTPAPERPILEGDRAAVWLLEASVAWPLETVLGRYLGIEPELVEVGRTDRGKPVLEGSALSVSLAHSGDVSLVAVVLEREIGVDVEPLRSDVDAWSLPSHALTEAERERLERIARPLRAQAFLSIWTIKEALLKAAGVGLGVDPRLIEFGADGKISAVPPALGVPDDWAVREIPLPGYLAAVVMRGAPAELALYDTRLR